ncbi:MAG TPA: effector-associated domain EAD1-containing protein [Streptosporangiaceae bacterium]|nr:effector-associated domain EAD1-containing protein [Streptosporangiaceae bacterium]
MLDPRLDGRGLAQLTAILSEAFRSPPVVIRLAVEAGIEEADIPLGTPREQWSAVLRLVDLRYPAGLNALLDNIRAELTAGKAKVPLGKLDGWLSRGARQENLQGAIRELVSNAAAISSHIDPRQVVPLLEAVRSNILDIVEWVDAGVADEVIRGSDPLQESADPKARILASCRRSRSAVDRFLTAVRRDDELRRNRRSNATEDVLLARDDAMIAVLFDRREAFEENIADLVATIRAHLPTLMPQSQSTN